MLFLMAAGGERFESQSTSLSTSRSLIDRARVGDKGVRGVRWGSSIAEAVRGDLIFGGGKSGECVVIEEDAVGVADDARDMSHAVEDVNTAGDAGLRYPS